MKALIMSMSLLVLSIAGHGEQLLLKNGGEYLGTKTGSDGFLTCAGGHLAVGSGKVRETDDRCSTSVVGPIRGSMQLSGAALIINDSHGNAIHFTLTTTEQEQLRAFAAGETIRVTFEDGTRHFAKN